jgi:hypothetical protein
MTGNIAWMIEVPGRFASIVFVVTLYASILVCHILCPARIVEGYVCPVEYLVLQSEHDDGRSRRPWSTVSMVSDAFGLFLVDSWSCITLLQITVAYS